VHGQEQHMKMATNSGSRNHTRLTGCPLLPALTRAMT
jgi:hypothetical protein